LKLPRIHNHLPKRSFLIAAAVLFLLSFLTAWFFQSKPSVGHHQKLLQRYITEQQEDAVNLLNDTGLLRRLVLHTESKESFDEIHQKKYGLFIFAETISESQDLLYWNKQEIIPPVPDFYEPDGIYSRQLINGYYVVHKKSLSLAGMSSNLVAYVLIPVLNQYYLETQASRTQFAHNEEAVSKIRFADKRTDFPVHSIDGVTLFFLEQAPLTAQGAADPVTLAIRLVGLILLLIYLHLFIETVEKKRGPWVAVATLATALIICRLVLYFLPGVFSLRQLPLFDPRFYAADSVNRSLGDLLISASFLCWIVLFAWAVLGPIKKIPVFLKGKGIIVAGVAAIFLLIFTTFQLAGIIYDLVANSKISFDVTDFFGLSIHSAFGFVVLALLVLTYHYFSRLLFRFILLAIPNLVYVYFTVAVVGLIFLTIRTGDLIVLFYLPILGWLVIYTLLLSQEQLIVNRLRITIAGMLFWLFVFSVSLAVLIMQGNQEREWRERQAIAEKYDELSDPNKARALNIALAFLTEDFLKKNFKRFYREPENRLLRDSFITTNSLGYFNSYNTSFYVFDAQGQPVNNLDNRSYEELDNILALQSKRVEGSLGLHYYETAFDEFIYITKREVTDDEGEKRGSLFIVSAPKHFETANDLYPNLFRQTSGNNIDRSPIYSYAIYKAGKLIKHSTRYGFSTQLGTAELPTQEFEKREGNGNTELWFKASTNKTVVIARKKDSLIESITMFSYLFCAFLFMVGVLQFFNFLIKLARNRNSALMFSSWNIRSQIHGTIIFISVLSFLIIGAATISFFSSRFNRNNIERLSRTASGAVAEMEQKVDKAGLLVNNVINFSDSASSNTLKTAIDEIANVHSMIVNIYDLDGNLRVTSDADIYRRGLLSTKMHPKAYFNLRNLHKVQFVDNEHINQFEYQSIYTAIRNTKGDTYAYLNVPSFNAPLELNQEISNFIVTIINLNAFIFLIAGVIALFITNRITRSFSVISDKMKEITLGRANEEIVWTRNDEIGELVKQYNKMVHQLERSADALAKSEREGAWREMARQVAHEIKNPLTPMKLSIQYLQRAIQTNQPNVQQLTSNVATTLIEQIDHLSKIAADFSQFANIGNKKVEEIDLHNVLRSLVDLYTSNPNMQMEWNPLSYPLMMRADKTHMNRLFTNLLTNAVDACSEARGCLISIDEKTENNFVTISIRDNGEGIPEEMRSKIFTPNFTTKTSGTGLGLAMCKSIVEQAGGSIWFQTKEGEGTTFYVRLPLLNQSF